MKIRLKRIIAIGILFMIFSQSCVVYQKTPVPIESVKGSTSVVKMVMKDGGVKHLHQLDYDSGKYIGNMGRGDFQVDTAAVEYIYLKDIQKSKRKNLIGLSVTLASVTIFYIILVSTFTVGSSF